MCGHGQWTHLQMGRMSASFLKICKYMQTKFYKKTQLLQEKLLGESPSEYSVKVLDAHQYFRCLI